MKSYPKRAHPRPLRAHIVARRLRVSVRTVTWWASTGLLPARRDGIRPWVFDEADVQELVRRRGLDQVEG